MTDAELIAAYVEAIVDSCRLVTDAAHWPALEPILRRSIDHPDVHGLRRVYELGRSA